MRRINRVLVIKGIGQYAQMRCAIDEMVKGFLAKGCLVTVLDLIYDEGEQLRLTKDWIDQYDLIFSMNLIGHELYISSNAENKPIFWGFLEDHPFHLHSRIDKMKGNVVLSCCDRQHVEYVERYYKNIKWNCFMPHGGIVGCYDNISYRERKYDVVFLGSLSNIDNLMIRMNTLREKYGQMFDDILHMVLLDNKISYEECVESIIDNNPVYDICDFAAFMGESIVVDEYRRFCKRKELLETLAGAGISVTIFGNGWEGLSESAKSIHVLSGVIDHSKIGTIMGNSRFVLNDMPIFLDGSHDRVFAAMQCGAVCVTDGSIVLEENFDNMQELVFYDSNHPEELTDLLSGLLNDPNTAERIAKAGWEAAKDQTWANRARDIVDIAEEL